MCVCVCVCVCVCGGAETESTFFLSSSFFGIHFKSDLRTQTEMGSAYYAAAMPVILGLVLVLFTNHSYRLFPHNDAPGLINLLHHPETHGNDIVAADIETYISLQEGDVSGRRQEMVRSRKCTSKEKACTISFLFKVEVVVQVCRFYHFHQIISPFVGWLVG